MVEKKELFLIDSDSFMAPYRLYYAFDLVPTYWKELAEHAKTGRLVILDMVKNEMNCNRAFIDSIMGSHGTSLIKYCF